MTRRDITSRYLGVAALVIALVIAMAVWTPAAGEGSKRFGGYVVHYNAFDTSSEFAPFVGPDVEIRDEPGRGMVVIAVRRTTDDGELEAIEAEVEGTVTNIIGQRERLHFDEVESDGFTSYVADFDLVQLRVGKPRGEFRIEIDPHPPNHGFVLEFEELFAPVGS